MINEFIKSLSRLYADGQVSKERIDELFSNGKISRMEYEYILAYKEIHGKEM